MRLRATRPAHLLAVAAQMLGFEPSDDFVVIPVGGNSGGGDPVPATRIDHPHTTSDVTAAVDTLANVYRGRHGAELVLLAVTEDRVAALAAAEGIAAAVAGSCTVVIAARIDDDEVRDLVTGDLLDTITDEVRSVIDAQMVAAGGRTAVAGRAQRAEDLVKPNAEPIGIEVVQAVTGLTAGSLAAETEWLLDVLGQAVTTGLRIDDTTAARVLVDVTGHRELRDAALNAMTRAAARIHVATWSDLVKQAPAPVRTEPSLILAFACWLAGDGAGGWIAYDHADAPAGHRFAGLVHQVLSQSIPPHTWSQE